jgi:hypothetical protein
VQGFDLSFLFLIGVAFVNYAVYLYGMPDLPKKDPSKSEELSKGGKFEHASV